MTAASPSALSHAATNIVAAWRAATPADLAQGLAWYDLAATTADRLAAGRYSREQAAGVIAAMSPITGWAANIAAAERLIELHAAGRQRCPSKGYGLRRNVRKAWAILRGADPLAVLSGPKVRAFYLNITGCPDSVTVDRWAMRVATADPDHPGTCSARQYDDFTLAYREAAEHLGVTPRDLQAATWTYYRRLHGQPHHNPKG